MNLFARLDQHVPINDISSPTGWKDQLLTKINRIQLDIRNEITGLVRQFKKDQKAVAVLALFVVSFLYGLIHALGPGHGKTIVMSAMLSDENSTVFKSVAVGSIVAFGEAISAIIIVYSTYYFSLGRIGSTFNQSEDKIKVVSYLFILLIGLLLLIFRTRKHLPLVRNNKHTHFGVESTLSTDRLIFLETHESVLELLEAIPGFQGSRNTNLSACLDEQQITTPKCV